MVGLAARRKTSALCVFAILSIPTSEVSAMKFRLVLAALVGAACFVSSCGGDDDGPIQPPDETPPVRNRPDSMLTSWFERAYNTQDADLYDEMLDSVFTFKFLPADADSFGIILGLDDNDSWSRSKDIQSTSKMFDDNQVTSVSLDFVSITNNPYTGGDCDGCRELTASLELNVTIDEPGSDEPLELILEGSQVFLAKADTADAETLWVLFRQIDQEPPGKTAGRGDGERGISSTQPTTWGAVKARFF
jgi:hypothetical protein